MITSNGQSGVVIDSLGSATNNDGSTVSFTLQATPSASIPNLQINTQETQLRGPPGAISGIDAAISADPDNGLILGSDEKLFVADTFTTDLVAQYILARG